MSSPKISPRQRTPGPVILGAAQIWSAKTRVARRFLSNPVARNEHFKKYNLGAATYDEDYARAYGEEYLTYLTSQIALAARKGVQLLLLPEFCFTPAVIASPMEGIAVNRNAHADACKLYTWSGALFTQWMSAQAKATGMLIGASCFLVRRSRIYNTGLLADETGRIILRYEKVHLPADEKMHIAAGRSYPVADTRFGRVGFSICYDVQFPEHHACLASKGVQIVLHPSAGYTLPGERADMGQQRLRVRASDHFAAVVYSCFAPENDWEPHDSAVIAPNGDVKSCVRGKRAGFAAASVEIPGKRSWPGDPADAPDRERIRRSLRRHDTYRVLTRAFDGSTKD